MKVRFQLHAVAVGRGTETWLLVLLMRVAAAVHHKWASSCTGDMTKVGSTGGRDTTSCCKLDNVPRESGGMLVFVWPCHVADAAWVKLGGGR